jgi:hypothetical protein
MKKLTTCVLSAGILMLTGLSDTEALFGTKAVNTETVAYTIFGADTTDLINAADKLKSGLTDAKKGITTAIVDMKKKQTIDLKTFDTTSTVVPIVFISERLANIATSFETIASLLEKEIDGLKSINKAKSAGNANEVAGRQGIRLSRKVMKVMEADLASTRANFALIGKLCKGEIRISNAGAIKTILEKHLTNITNAKKNIVDQIAKYEEESTKIANSAKDKEILGLFKVSKSYIAAEKDIINLYVQLLQHVITYAKTGDSSDLEEFSSKCEELLGGEYTAIKYQRENYEELDKVEKTSRGNVNKKRNQLESDPTFRSEKGKKAQTKSQLESSLSSRSSKAKKIYEDSVDEYETQQQRKKAAAASGGDKLQRAKTFSGRQSSRMDENEDLDDQEYEAYQERSRAGY